MAEFKEYHPLGGQAKDSLVDSVLNGVSERIERFLDRWIVSRGTITEWHSMDSDGIPLWTPKLWLHQWPAITVTSVHEDTGWPRAYGASALLVVNTDYQLSDKRVLRRLGSNGARNWAAGNRAIQVIYTAGYATTSAVPQSIKQVALRYAAALYDESSRKQHGIQTQTDATGNFTRFGPATLTREMERDLYDERRLSMHTTGEFGSVSS